MEKRVRRSTTSPAFSSSVSAPLLLEITRDVVSEVAQHGGIAIGPYRVGVHALWPLMFIQAQIAGAKLLWAQGIDLVLGS
jgi:hypothetical protein